MRLKKYLGYWSYSLPLPTSEDPNTKVNDLNACLLCLSDCLSVCLSLCLSVCLSVRLSVCLSACLSVCLSVCSLCFLALSVYLIICLFMNQDKK